MAPENPEATTVSGFFRTPIFKCRQKDIFLCPEDLNYRQTALRAGLTLFSQLSPFLLIKLHFFPFNVIMTGLTGRKPVYTDG